MSDIDTDLIELVKAKHESLMICRVTDIGGVESPISAKTALKNHSKLFFELFEKMQSLIDEEQNPKKTSLF